MPAQVITSEASPRAAAKGAVPSLSQLRAGLLAPGDDKPFVAPAWLTASRRDPAAFWRAIGPVLAGAPGGSARSSLFERYNLFHELGARHEGRGRLGYAELDQAAGWMDSSYASLCERASILARAWRDRGVAPGACIAVVQSMSAELVVALLAAWRCGAAVTPLPAFGRTFLRNRLAALAPDHVAATKGRALWLGVAEDTALPIAVAADEGVRPDRDPPHLYAPDETAARFFSPLGADPLAVVDVPAERLYLGALRDGALLLGLEAGEGLAAPGFCDVQEKPPLLLAALAMGACWSEASFETARVRLEDLLTPRVHALGVTDELRDVFLGAPVKARGALVRWFRNPAAPPSFVAWDKLAAHPLAARARGANLFVNGAAGGAIVCSPWRANPGRGQVLPAPGRRWTLGSAHLHGVESLGGSGVLTDADEELTSAAVGRPVLVDGGTGDELLWVTCLDAHRLGKRLPAREICALVTEAHEAVWGCALVDYPHGEGKRLDVGAALLCFLRPDVAAPARLTADIEDTIRVELGESFAPDRIELYPVAPRWLEGETSTPDPEWCRAQYVGGILALKRREPLFAALAGLRHRLWQATE